MLHLGANFGGSWRFELGFLYLFFSFLEFGDSRKISDVRCSDI